MKDKVFIDTNIFVYIYSVDEIYKRNICIETIKNYKCITSTQVLNELSNVFLRKWKLSSEEILKAIQEIESFCSILLVETTTIKKAININKRYGFSYYDSLILASALLSQCKYILTEDMQDKQKIDGLEIKNILIT